MVRILLFDTETGGLTTRHTLLTAFFLILDGDLNILGELELNLKPRSKKSIETLYDIYNVDKKALEVNKIDLKKHDEIAITYKEGSNLLEAFLNKHRDFSRYICCGHNVRFDIKFLKRCLVRKRFWNDNFSGRIIDTCDLAFIFRIAGKIPSGHSLQLEKLASYFKCPDRESHIAREDVLMTHDLLTCLTKNIKFSQVD